MFHSSLAALLFFAAGIGNVFAQNLIDTAKHPGNPFAERQSVSCGGINFRWDFEGGSLDSVALVSQGDTLVYDLFSRRDPLNPADPKLPPSSRWYLFRMEGTSGKRIKLNIKRSECRRPFWSLNGVEYERLSAEEAPLGQGYILLDCATAHPADTIYIAYHNPYLASRLNKKIEQWSKLPFVQVSSIGKSYEGREMPLLHITEPSDCRKYVVYIHGRIHTSESPSSWHLEKLIDLIVANTPHSKRLREQLDLYILPFTNPDGVVNGLSRSALHGINLEVNHADPDSLTAVEVKNIRAFLTELTSKGKAVDLFLNMHSQIADYVTYWIHTAESSSKEAFFNLMKIANLTTSQNRLFTKGEFSFSKMHPKYLEGWFWDRFKEKTTALTFETPYSFYGRKRGEVTDTLWVSERGMEELAANSYNALGDFFGIESQDRLFAEPKSGGGARQLRDKEYLYPGKSYVLAKRNGAKTIYKRSYLDAGKYNLYIWRCNLPGICEGDDNAFVKVGTIEQKKNGKFKYKYNKTIKGERLGTALLLPVSSDL